MPDKKLLPIYFYTATSGNRPVKDFLDTLGRPDTATIGSDLWQIEKMGTRDVGPICKALRDGLWEVRSTISGPRKVRIIFSIENGKAALLHAFFKTTQKTPGHEIDLAIARRADMKRRGLP